MVLGLAQLGVALAVRARPDAGTPRNWSLLAAVALSGVLQIAGVLLAPLRTLLGTEPLTVPQLLVCAAVAAVPGAALWLVRRGQARSTGVAVTSGCRFAAAGGCQPGGTSSTGHAA